MEHLLYLLDSAGLQTRKKVSTALYGWPTKRVYEIREQLSEIISAEDNTGKGPKPGTDPFDFVASASMRGEDSCVLPECRAQKARTLARYGALYARRVLIPVRSGISPFPTENEDDLRTGLAGTLMSILEYRPLIEAGIATLVPGVVPYCDRHLSLAVSTHPQIESITKALCSTESKKFSISFERSIEYCSEENIVHLRGPADYLPHGRSLLVLNERPDWLPKELNARRAISKTSLSRRYAKRSRVIERMFRQLSYDVTLHQYYTRTNDATYLTDMCGEARILDLLHKNRPDGTRNAIIARNLFHSVPLFSEVPISRVIQARRRDPEAFLQYRAAIAKAIQEFANDKPNLTEGQAKSIYYDIIEPQLASLRIQARNLRRIGIRKAAAKAVASFVAVGLGVYSGLLPSDLANLFKVAGGVGLLSQLGEAAALIEKNPAEIKNHNLYFLLKLQSKG